MWSRRCCATSLELKREASGLQKSETQRSVEDKGEQESWLFQRGCVTENCGALPRSRGGPPVGWRDWRSPAAAAAAHSCSWFPHLAPCLVLPHWSTTPRGTTPPRKLEPHAQTQTSDDRQAQGTTPHHFQSFRDSCPSVVVNESILCIGQSEVQF